MDTTNNSSRKENLEWEIIENFINDDYEEQYLRLVAERQMQQAAPRRRRRAHIVRSCEEGHARLINDYFSNNPVYTEQQFRRKFRMRRDVFLRIVEALENHDEYFLMRADATERMGLSPLKKCTAAIRILAYGSPADSVDDYVRINESTALECLDKFVNGVYEIFEDDYLRRPNNNDIEHLLQIGEARGFPGSNNDTNVLNGSPVFNNVLEGQAPKVQYMVNGTQYDMRYYLADVIYPERAMFVKTITMPQGDKRKLFAQYQEIAKKDVERVFGVFQSRFAIIRGPVRAWNISTKKCSSS